MPLLLCAWQWVMETPLTRAHSFPKAADREATGDPSFPTSPLVNLYSAQEGRSLILVSPPCAESPEEPKRMITPQELHAEKEPAPTLSAMTSDTSVGPTWSPGGKRGQKDIFSICQEKMQKPIFLQEYFYFSLLTEPLQH